MRRPTVQRFNQLLQMATQIRCCYRHERTRPAEELFLVVGTLVGRQAWSDIAQTIIV
jgi:hypothetical protein